MRKLMLLVGSLMILLFVSGASGFGQEKYIPKPDEELYGTWINEQMNPPRMVRSPDGSFAGYFPATYSKPFQGGESEIFRKWTDSEGSVYYETFDTFTFGSPMFNKTQDLWKVSKSGKVLEMIRLVVGDFRPDRFPTFDTKIDHMSTEYFIYYRANE